MAALKSRQHLAKQVGKKIRKVRLSKGISLKHFEALEHALNRHALSDIEHGKKLPNLYTLYRISVVLGVSIDELLSV